MTSTFGGATGLSLVAALFWGGGDFCGGLATRKASPYLVVAVAHSLSLLALLLIASAFRVPLPSLHAAAFGLMAGLAGGLGLIAFYKALSLGEMGLTATVTGVLNTGLPVLFALLTLGSPKPLQLAGFAIAALAIALIAYAPAGGTHARGLLLATGAGIGFGLLLILLQRAAQESLVWALTFSRISSSVLATTLLLLPGPARMKFPLQKAMWIRVLPLAALAGILDTGGNLFYAAASLAGRLDIAAVLSSLYPAVTILLAMWLLRERATRLQTAGMVLALAAVALISS